MDSISGRRRLLAFEPYDRGSHRAVRLSISRHSRHAWTWRTRPGRAWKWRMRLAAAELVEAAAREGVLDAPADAIFATSLMSLADLRALLPASLRALPAILSMHENQVAYPAGHIRASSSERDVHFGLTNLTSMLAADLVIWNSRWNLESFLDGIAEVLAHAPDASLSDVRQRIEEKSVVIWPPVEPPPGDLVPAPVAAMGSAPALHNPVTVVWPHRWEHDKGTEELLEIARRESERFNLRWTILGEQFDQVPPALEELRAQFASRIDHMGFEPDRLRYWQRLAGCDWVLSTARHEFFGIAAVEAMLAGCLPWLPERLSYPELLPQAARGLSPDRPPEDPVALLAAIRTHLEPAIAANAVARLDEAVEEVIERCSGSRSP